MNTFESENAVQELDSVLEAILLVLPLLLNFVVSADGETVHCIRVDLENGLVAHIVLEDIVGLLSLVDGEHCGQR